MDALAAAVAAALALAIGMTGARLLLDSQLYHKSRVISTILRQDAFEVSALVENRRSVDMLVKFVGAAAAAYIDFEFIPIDEAATFAAVYESVPPGVDIGGFAYRGATLLIDGRAESSGELYLFERALMESGRFFAVNRTREGTESGGADFRLECSLKEI